MNELGFKIEYADYHDGQPPVAWLVYDSGVRRLASPDEAALWKALQLAEQKLTRQKAR